MAETQTYLGDSVYAAFDGYHIVLTTENGFGGASNTIYLEPPVLEALNRFYLRLQSEPRAPEGTADDAR